MNLGNISSLRTDPFTKVPRGLEKAGAELTELLSAHYNRVLFGEQAFQNFLDGTP